MTLWEKEDKGSNQMWIHSSLLYVFNNVIGKLSITVKENHL